jgi:hypothetical protein
VLGVPHRRNVCKRCGNIIGDTYVNSQGQVVPTKRTVIHLSYGVTDVLDHSEELLRFLSCKITLDSGGKDPTPQL